MYREEESSFDDHAFITVTKNLRQPNKKDKRLTLAPGCEGFSACLIIQIHVQSMIMKYIITDTGGRRNCLLQVKLKSKERKRDV